MTKACPNCGSARVYRARHRHLGERALTVLGCTMQRCHECNERYARFGNSMLEAASLSAVLKKLILALSMAAAVLVLMGAILWFSHAQAVQPHDAGRVEPAGAGYRALLIRV